MNQQQAKLFLQKISEFSAEAKFYYGSKSISDAIIEINNRYTIEEDSVSELISVITLDNFNFKHLDDLVKENLYLNTDAVKQVVIDILGMIFLPIERHIKPVEIKNEIEKRGGQASDYQKYLDKFDEEIEDRNFEILDELIKKHEELVDPEEEEKAAFKIFQNNIVDVIQASAKEAARNLNGGLIYLLFNKKDFKSEINKILLTNSEVLTHKKFVINGKSHSPNIGNWLKDFIKRQGTGIFDNVTLTNYVTNSENGKILDVGERKIVTKLLMLYRNLKFFPDSMPNDTGENWEIIPVELTGRGREKIGNISGPPKTVEEKEIDRLKVEEEKYMTGGLEQQAIEEEMEKKKKVEDLKAIAGKYKPDSLEYKAMMEEIEKIKK